MQSRGTDGNTKKHGTRLDNRQEIDDSAGMEAHKQTLSVSKVLAVLGCMAPRLCADFSVVKSLCFKLKPALEVYYHIMPDAWWSEAASLYCKLEKARQNTLHANGWRELTDLELKQTLIREARIEKESEHVED